MNLLVVSLLLLYLLILVLVLFVLLHAVDVLQDVFLKLRHLQLIIHHLLEDQYQERMMQLFAHNHQ